MRHLFFQLLLFVLILITARYTAADLTEELVVYFTFDTVKDKRILDESGNGLDAEIIENAKFVEGKYGNAIRITDETEDCVNIPSADALEIDEEITMMAWVYHENRIESTSQWLDKGSYSRKTNSGYGMMFLDKDDHGPGIGVNLGGELQRLFIIRSDLIQNGLENKTWHHMVATYNDTIVKAYLNGEIILELETIFIFNGINDHDLRIGCAKNRPQYAFEGGSIDEVAIWSRALSEDEVKKAMRDPLLSVSPQGKAATTWSNIKRKAFYDKPEK